MQYSFRQFLGKLRNDLLKDRITCCTELGVPDLIQHIHGRTESLDDLFSLRERVVTIMSDRGAQASGRVEYEESCQVKLRLIGSKQFSS